MYRTAIGFEDAYVAAPSQKAALEAWGTDKNLFARGAAELVKDEALAAEPLASPGKVIRRPRGTAAQHLAAVGHEGKAVRSPKPRGHDDAPPVSVRRAPRRRPPRPSHDAVERAITAIEACRRDFDGRLAELDAQIEELHDKRRQIRARRDAKVQQLEANVRAQEERYRKALAAWEDSA